MGSPVQAGVSTHEATPTFPVSAYARKDQEKRCKNTSNRQACTASSSGPGTEYEVLAPFSQSIDHSSFQYLLGTCYVLSPGGN